MSDTLEVFGIEYHDVTGIKATDNNGVVQSFIHPAGTLSITNNGITDVTSYASVNVNVSGGTQINNQDKNVVPSESQQSVTYDTGYTGLGTVTVSAISSTYVGSGVARKSSADLTASGSTVTVPVGYYSTQATKSISAGSAFPPSVTITTNPTITLNSSTGVVTATYSGSSYITPTVTAGYISQGTSGRISTAGTSTFQIPSKAAATYTPTTTDQYVTSRQYLTGSQTIKGDANLIAANIASGVSIFGVNGTLAFVTYYSGTGNPASSLGSNGDIYLKTV